MALQTSTRSPQLDAPWRRRPRRAWRTAAALSDARAGTAGDVAFVDAATLGDDAPAFSAPARAFKRSVDLVLATAALLAVLPVLVLAALAVKVDSHGPVLFAQTRVGARGKRFRIYKLRTMIVDNDDSVHRAYVAALIRGEADRQNGMFKLVRDPRITRVGRVLRRFSLDELPQLWNVVRGDMSLVGPRPPLPAEVELYDDRALQRLSAKPGITGLPQVRGRCELTFSESVELDIEYVRSWSVLLELKILLLTPFVVLSKRGAA